MKRSYLVVAALLLALFVAVVVAHGKPQQLHSAGVSDLVGSWIIDGDAMWDKLRTNPQVAKELAGLSPEMIEQAKSTLLTEVSANSYQFTTDKLIWKDNGARLEESYAITSVNGNSLTADCIDDQGKTIQNQITVTQGRLEMFSPTSPNKVVILKRVP